MTAKVVILCPYLLMCARAVLLTKIMLVRLSVEPRLLISDSTSWISATLPLLLRAWTSLVMARAKGTEFDWSIDFKLSIASVKNNTKIICKHENMFVFNTHTSDSYLWPGLSCCTRWWVNCWRYRSAWSLAFGTWLWGENKIICEKQVS